MNKYISREAVVRYLKEYSEKECNSNSPYGMITSSVLNKAERAISELPAADVQSVKQGQWICEFYNDVFDVYQADCSACKRESTNKYDKVSESYEYCPHCGARMDGDTNGI